MKKIISLILIVSVIFTMTGSVFAQKPDGDNPMSREAMIEKAVEMGVSIEEAQQMSDLVLKGITKYDGEVVVLRTTRFTNEDGEFKEIKETIETDGQVTTSSYQINPSDFDLTLAVVRINSPGYDEYVITNTGEWAKYEPLWNLTDIIATSWSDDFTLLDESCVYQGYNAKHGWYHESCSIKKIDAEEGIAHNVNLRVDHTDKAAQQTINIRKSDSQGTMNVVGEYCHVTIGLSNILVTFGAGSAVGFAAGLGTVLYEAEPEFQYIEY